MSVRPAAAWKPVAVVTLALGVFLLVLAPGYGPHRDELYFASAGHRLAWGYPDQPAMVALLARITEDLAGHSLLALRTPSVLAVCASLVMSVGLVRLLGGSVRAQVLMAVLFASSNVVLAFGHLLETGTFSFLAWTALALVAAHTLVDDRPRLWLLAGLVAGIGLNAKHDLVVALMGLMVGIAATPAVRHHLRSPWWWAGGGVALLLWLPNLVWQAQHGWPVFVLSGEIRDEYGGAGGATQYVVLTLLIFSPLVAAVWIAGLLGLLRRTEWAWARPLGWIFLVSFAFFLVTGGKAYYVAGAIPPLLAAGSVLAARRFRRVRPIAILVLSAAVAWPAVLPLLPARTYAGSVYPALSDTGIESIGWPELVASVRRALAPLPKGAIVFTGNYGEAGALEWYGVPARVYSGHNGWADFGPPPDGAGPVVVLGYRDPSADFTGCRRVGTVPTVDGAENEEHGGRIFVCAGPRKPWSQEWKSLSHLDA
jgi:4-amino-4-deoxy-L-arabinose transferase-like glycosyltransferase